MCIISVVMPVCNNEKYVYDAIKSVLKQSFVDFELIIPDFGSTDNTLSIAGSFKDKRIHIANNAHNYINALNSGLEFASGKYVALMCADDMMHVDRLKIQYALLEAEPTIAVSGTWIKQICSKVSTGSTTKGPIGLIDNPLLTFLQGNCLLHPTIMLRKSFLIKHELHYENYPYAEDFKLWSEVAKQGGQFHIENQPLLYYRMIDGLKNEQKYKEQQSASEDVINEVVEYLININKTNYPELETVLAGFQKLQHAELITKKDIAVFFHNLFMKNKNNLIISCI